tara:strand:- start:405 stop:605 length:201 start_codon:yes stop_codon:yes gene_type:complete
MALYLMFFGCFLMSGNSLRLLDVVILWAGIGFVEIYFDLFSQSLGMKPCLDWIESRQVIVQPYGPG